MWPSIIIIDNFLDGDQLSHARDLAESANFRGGGVTAGGGNLQVKNNEEMEPDPSYVELVKMIEQTVKQNQLISYSMFPRTISRPIINRYEEGMYYGEHIDSPVLGFSAQGAAAGPYGQNFVRSDFSMTVFLSDPDSYDGGELKFTSPLGEHLYKLPAGSAVAYPTGLPHRVMPVSNGARVAAILWLQSMVRDHESRRMISDLYALADRVATALPDSEEARLAGDCASNALRINADL